MARSKAKGLDTEDATADDRAGSPRWPALAALLTVFALLTALAVRQVGSLDAGFHLEAGEHILSGHGWPRSDSFTYTVNDRPYIDTSWGYQVVLALIHRLFGPAGLVLFHAALALAIFLLVTMTAKLAPTDATILVPLLLLGVLASEIRFEVRPEMLSYTLLALVLYLLHRHAEGRASPLWLLPAIFLVWCNSHSLFVLGWAALACFVLGLWLGRGRLDRRLLAWSAAAAGVGLINPYGLRGMTFPFTLATRFDKHNVFHESISEFVSPFDLDLSQQNPFYPRLPIFSFRILFILVALSCVMLPKQKRFWSVFLAASFLFLSFKMVRNMPLLVIGSLPGVAWTLSTEGLARRARLSESNRRALRLTLLGAAAAVALLLGLRVWHDAYYIASRRPDRFGLSLNRSVLPADAAEFAARVNLSGRMLNHLNFGGYLMWARPDPVFIDGRLEVIGEGFYDYYRNALASSQALEACVARYGIGWITFPYKTNPQLLGRLSRDPRWRLAYFDQLAAIFIRDGPGAMEKVQGMVREATLPARGPVELGTIPGLAGEPRLAGVSHWLAGLIAREHFPEEPFSHGLFHYFRGEPARAASLFAEAIRAGRGAYYEIYNNLGSALFRLGRQREAADCYRVVLRDEPGNQLARERLAQIDPRRQAPAP